MNTTIQKGEKKMDGNLAMANHLVNETEDENSFWADVYHYMKENDCNEESAIEVITAQYKDKCIF